MILNTFSAPDSLETQCIAGTAQWERNGGKLRTAKVSDGCQSFILDGLSLVTGWEILCPYEGHRGLAVGVLFGRLMYCAR